MPTVILDHPSLARSESLLALFRDGEVRRLLYPLEDLPPSAAEAHAEWTQDGSPADRCATIRLRDTGERAGLIRVEDGNLSYFVTRDHWGKGICSAAVRIFLRDYATCRPLHAVVCRDNPASRRVLESAGFAFAGLSSAPLTMTPLLKYNLFS